MQIITKKPQHKININNKNMVLADITPGMVAVSSQPPKKHVFLHRKTSYNTQMVKIGPQVQRVRGTTRQKTKEPYIGKLDIRPDNPHHLIKILFVWHDGWSWAIVLSFKFHQNWTSGYQDKTVEIWLLPLLWPLAYTTACTTIQALHCLNQKKEG